MTTKTFKQKTPTVEAIEVTNILDQAPEIANLVKAKSLSVNMADKSAQFVLDDGKPFSAVEGQVVYMDGSQAKADTSENFYSSYEKAQ